MLTFVHKLKSTTMKIFFLHPLFFGSLVVGQSIKGGFCLSPSKSMRYE